MNSKEKADFTQGSILKKLFWFMVPILGALILLFTFFPPAGVLFADLS
mgnify:CR=1 FL=1